MFQVEEPRAGVAVLRIDDGKVNAMGLDYLAAFPKAFREAGKGDRAVVLIGNAKAFGAGLDLKTLPTFTEAQSLEFCRAFMQAFHDVLTHPRPVVAAVDGPAIAGGAVLSLSSDFRLVTPRAKLGVTEVPVGVPFPYPVLNLCRSLLPPQEHAPALLQGAIREGEACVTTGWAHRLVPGERLREEAIALAAELASMSPLAYARAKRDLNGPVVADFERFLKTGVEDWVAALRDPVSQQAITSFMARLAKK
ncbi:MAG TPA: enoyl-CoA hydratase/isomerase family protein [Candidatus Thermoplasmatota archaeon]|nr:enoyl-CoA hydratase/isomerase family protein [Candidatus Thermoplasmatota archaeon]